MNAHQRKVARKKQLEDFCKAVDALTEEDVAEILKQNLLLHQQITRFSSHMNMTFKL